jgi:hypothetical protein
MPAYLGFSIASSASRDVSAQEQLLLRVAAACPADTIFYDVLRDGENTSPVRVVGGPSARIERVAASEAPSHVAESFGSFARDLLWHFEDLGDVLIPALDADLAGDLDGGDGVPRVLGSLDELADTLEDDLADNDFSEETEPETLDFLKMLRDKVAIARRQQLPLVATW